MSLWCRGLVGMPTCRNDDWQKHGLSREQLVGDSVLTSATCMGKRLMEGTGFPSGRGMAARTDVGRRGFSWAVGDVLV